MKRNPNVRHITAITLLLCLSLLFFTGCDSSPIAALVVDSQAYETGTALDSAQQPATLEAGSDVHASMRVIESPLGMKYTAKWFLNGKEIFSEEKATTQDKTCILVFTLDKALVGKGALKMQIQHRGQTLIEKEIPVE